MKRILIIEDNTGQQKVYQHWFSEHDYDEVGRCELDFCDNISDAFLLLKQNHRVQNLPFSII